VNRWASFSSARCVAGLTAGSANGMGYRLSTFRGKARTTTILAVVAAGVSFEEIASKGGSTSTAVMTPRSVRRGPRGLCLRSAQVSGRRLVVLGGVTTAVVCNRLKSGVVVPCRYEPGLQKTYEEFATHAGTVILPARPPHPRDKAKIEAGVLVAERWLLARLRHDAACRLQGRNIGCRARVGIQSIAAPEASVDTSKPAIRGRGKSGHRGRRSSE